MPVRRFRFAAFSVLFCAAVSVLSGLAGATPALAHGFSTAVYVDITDGSQPGHVRTQLDVEYDLYLVSVAQAEKDDPLYRAGMPAWENSDLPGQQLALNTHRTNALKYLTDRFVLSAGSTACTPAQVGDFVVHLRDVPYATVVLDWSCPEQEHDPKHGVTSSLFADDEGFVKGAETIVTYHLDGRSGSAVLDRNNPTLSIQQSVGKRFWEFFRLGAEHLYTGLDHLLFLLALIAGSRRLREIVLAATAFTLAHSVTFILAALGAVKVSASVVEPLIALSIAVVAGWHLWRLVVRRGHASDIETDQHGHFALDRAGWTRLAVVFAFGLIHGLGFAGALGIDEAFSWSLLWSLLVFNLGIEFVQLAIIALLFPALALLRRHRPVVARWVTGLIAAGVTVLGLVWFVQRLL
ncbi:HupE/UreJ family protein [Nakamurella lactea]|uniref:HupE/UreJ family protein n=1 Tax=Nakamurella lactea TaxID=459515 RepID=UPI000429C664|nr:HupE/UreJ family protein [Nakamurella lactea]